LRIARELPRWQWTWVFHFIPRVIRDAIYLRLSRFRHPTLNSEHIENSPDDVNWRVIGDGSVTAKRRTGDLTSGLYPTLMRTAAIPPRIHMRG
jgi:predicted DCC family thiol-disulfide oxidoreductase YuxK